MEPLPHQAFYPRTLQCSRLKTNLAVEPGGHYKDTRPEGLGGEEEPFGPLAPFFRFKDEADVIAQANDIRFGLPSEVYAKDLRGWLARP
ncbi:aldehyde dehydrogenase family protein [Mesorhizobium sp. M3A.F.Ca.ET.174.01.1.1]|nr:MAG: aldehyde dehydrogenase family protein [Mesorhizobium sp.]TGS64276.1 aldehyde dehydrogenase family protein [Mesorhizobium sp. M3A.F.Ca.ET.201.01.1.1]TGS85997.1 aldehyde dehydrogenase family protein [Mesorhizobium sp. M3A.F.Ca.ET.175.01.1.1]TGT23938.1 aldehyde dehydrogenase family protein [Mesorhizobium sp. M3A.F.Ca.ET.174.01.1.1]RWB90955.1 MAG: aldehyde dehydrogenase family protein [Mesorhizobium sp.]